MSEKIIAKENLMSRKGAKNGSCQTSLRCLTTFLPQHVFLASLRLGARNAVFLKKPDFSRRELVNNDTFFL